MILKVVFGSEIHLFNSNQTYNELRNSIQKSFKKLPDNWTLSYSDTENDQVSIGSEEDLKIFQASVISDKPVKIFIYEVSEQRIVT